ncbi:major facilitator superfamily domain-containing protein [Mycena haematopus]|nr:major facilitator superfamily domain-containing protein [Mycena haematopus]KAJ7222976.1 major facilitator superfamily domain-containing protein [Mycena haematopus]
MENKESESSTSVLGNTISNTSEPASFEVPDGGLVAWRTVAGAWLVLFATFGYSFTFGVYEDYYVRVFLTNHTPSSIAWIGSFQIMMPFLLGPVAGKIFDEGGFHALQISGGLIFTFSAFMLSLCQQGQYYQVFLAQGLGMGIGLGFTYLPSVTIVMHHFKRHSWLVSGIVMSGSSVGSTVFPLITNHLLPRVGFAQTIRLTGAIIPPVLILGNLMMRTRLPPRSKRGHNVPPPDIKSFFVDPAYMIAVLGMFLGLLGLYFPLVYLQLFSVQHNIGSTLAFHSISILNASGAFVRLFGNYWADAYGPYNLQVGCSIASGVLIFAMLGVHNAASLVVIALLYGAFSNWYLALAFACFASLAKGPEEVGARGGIALAFCSLGALVSGPIQGALLTNDYHWIRPVVFAGTMTFASGVCFFVTRTLHARATSNWRV